MLLVENKNQINKVPSNALTKYQKLITIQFKTTSMQESFHKDMRDSNKH